MNFKLLSFLFAFLVGQVAFAEFNVPNLTAPVVDLARLLNRSEERALNQTLRSIHERGIGQFAILVLPEMNGEAIENVAIKTYDAWKLGTEKKDDGVLIVVAVQERKVRIEVGQGFEGVLTDLDSKRIIDYDIAPLFKKGEFYGGLSVAVLRILKKIAPKEASGVAGGARDQESDSQDLTGQNSTGEDYSTINCEGLGPSCTFGKKVSQLLNQFGVLGLLLILFLAIWAFVYLVINFIIFILNTFIFISRPLGVKSSYIKYISFAVSVMIMFRLLWFMAQVGAHASRGGMGGGGGGYSGGGGRSSGGGASGGW